MSAPSVKPRSRMGSWASFERRYQPIASSTIDDTVLRDWREIPTGTDIHLVWTVLDCDGRLCIVPGFASVNYYARILCTNPWPEIEEGMPGYVY